MRREGLVLVVALPLMGEGGQLVGLAFDGDHEIVLEDADGMLAVTAGAERR